MNSYSIQSIQNSISKITSQTGQPGRNHDFDSLFIEAVYKKFDTGIIMNMQYSWDLYRKGFDASKKSNFDIANYYFQKGKEAISKSDFDEVVLKYLNIYTTPKLSYSFYRKEDYEMAIELTWKSLFETEYIESEFPNMHMGKIQQLHNIARIMTKQKKYEEAFEYEKNILDYLMLQKQPDLPGQWNASLLNNCDKELVSLMTFQIFSEKIVNFFLYPNTDKEHVLQYITSLKDFVPHYPSDEAYLSFIKAIDGFASSDYQKLKEYSEELLIKGNIKFNALKHYLILRLLTFIDLQNTDEASKNTFIETLQSHIRVTPFMLNKYRSQLQLVNENA